MRNLIYIILVLICDSEKTWVMAGHWTRIITRSHPNQGERSQTIYWCQKFAAQREVVWGKNTNILNNYNVTQNLKRTIIYTKLHDMPLSWKLLFGYLHIFFLQKWEMRPANNWNVLYTSSGSPKVLEDGFFCVSSNILSKRLGVFWWFVMTIFCMSMKMVWV